MVVLYDQSDSLTFPNGKTYTADELKTKPEYAILFEEPCGIEVNDSGITNCIMKVSDLANFVEASPKSPKDVIAAYNKKIEDLAAKGVKAQEKIDKAISFAAFAMPLVSSSLNDDKTAEYSAILPDFVSSGHEYKIGDSFIYEGKTYRVAQSHTSQDQWKPGSIGTESLYYQIVIAPDGILVWRTPSGGHDAPGMGAKRHYPDAEGPIYVSKRDGNTSVPGTDEWWELEE